MTQPGGPAALSGFLYQILHHATWLADLSLQGKVNGQRVDSAQLILEPRDGGDAKAETPGGVYLVEQYKNRGTSLPWSLSQIEEVLGDLFKAVPESPRSTSIFRIVTNGRAGQLTSFAQFCSRARAAETRTDLDGSLVHVFRRAARLTDRDYFDLLVERVHPRRKPGLHSARIRMLHLLSNLDTRFGADADQLEKCLELQLRRYVPHLGAEVQARKTLTAELFERLSRGAATLNRSDVNQILQRVGLSIEIVTRIQSLAETMERLTRQTLDRWRYSEALDVRGLAAWPDGSVLLIYGRSGSGKTWQLNKTLLHLARLGHVVTLVHASRSAEECLTAAARKIWQIGLGETTDLTFAAVCTRLRMQNSSVGALPIIVAVDDVKDLDVARELLEQDWDVWGAKLVLTTTEGVAHSVRLASQAVAIHHTGNFSIVELQTRLSLGNRDWLDLPPILRELLRMPILCGIHLEGTVQASNAPPPSCEYEVLERYWGRLLATGTLGDSGIALALSRRAFEGGTYPIERPQWHEIGLTAEAAARLESTGWLQVDEAGRASFFHDRLLDWAVAESLTVCFKAKDVSLDDLKRRIEQLSAPDSAPSVSQQFAYVLMDIAWLLCGSIDTHKAALDLLDYALAIGALGSAEHFHANLLTTLGVRALPVLEHRIQSSLSLPRSDATAAFSLGKALAVLDKVAARDVGDIVVRLLSSNAKMGHSIALVATQLSPNQRHIDLIWELHKVRHRDVASGSVDSEMFIRYQESFDALRACVQSTPEWLQERILSASPGDEPVSELAYLLVNVETEAARLIWNDYSEMLFSKIATDKPRSLITCISRFGDRSRIGFLLEHLTDANDHADTAAFPALASLDPSAAIQALDEVDQGVAYLTRASWLPALLETHNDLVCSRILSIAQDGAEGRQMVESLFAERPNLMTLALFQYYLNALERELQELADASIDTREVGWISRSMDLLRRVQRLDLQAAIEERAGQPLERLIVDLSVARLSRANRVRSSTLDGAGTLLARMGGGGLSRLIQASLASENSWARMPGLRWASLDGSERTVSLLAEVTLAAASRLESGDDNCAVEFAGGLSAIACAGDDATLVGVIQTAKNSTLIPRGLAAMRRANGPLPPGLAAGAIATIDDPLSTEAERQTALVVAYVSGSDRFLDSLRSTARRADPHSYIARLVMLALSELSDESPDALKLAHSMATPGLNRSWGLRALASMSAGQAAALQKLAGEAETLDDDDIDFVLDVLYKVKGLRERTVEVASVICLGRSLYSRGPYIIASESASQLLRDRVLERAFSSHPILSNQKHSSVRALAKFDPERACQAIEQAVLSGEYHEFDLCRLMVRVSPESAAQRLIALAIRAGRKALPGAIGRALRPLNRQQTANAVAQRIESDPSARAVLIDLAAWIPDPGLYEVLAQVWREDLLLRQAAMTSMEQHRAEAHCEGLCAEIRSGELKWPVVVALAESASPLLLRDHEDSLCIFPMLHNSHAMQEYVRRAIERRL